MADAAGFTFDDWPLVQATPPDYSTTSIPFRSWDGRAEDLSVEEKTALANQKLLIAISDSPGRFFVKSASLQPMTSLSSISTGLRITRDRIQWTLIDPVLASHGTTRIGLLRVVREKSWEVSPPSPSWTGPMKQVRRRKLGSWPNFRAYIPESERQRDVWPRAWVYAAPPNAEWFESYRAPEGSLNYMVRQLDNPLATPETHMLGPQRIRLGERPNRHNVYTPWGRFGGPIVGQWVNPPTWEDFRGQSFMNPFTGNRETFSVPREPDAPLPSGMLDNYSEYFRGY